MNDARNKIWVNRLIAGTQTWEQMPDFRREAVKEELRRRVINGEPGNRNSSITKERYAEIVQEPYEA